MEIKRSRDHIVTVTNDTVGYVDAKIQSNTVEANLLFAILEKLEEIRCGIEDLEDEIGCEKNKLDESGA